MRFSTDETVMWAERLRAELPDRVITPGDGGYDRARTVFSGAIDRRPVAIVRPVDPAEVARVVVLAGESGLPLAVRSGGHGIHSVCDGGIVLDLAELRGLDIDVPGRTAWAQTGLTAGQYTTAAAAHGLATGFGDTGSVGIGGLTVGGGVGYLVRKYGLTIDDVLAAEVVTADGRVLRADEQSHPDLFWAIRGGGGNFGVVTRFQYRLHPVQTVVGGMLMLPATPEVIASFVAEAQAAPDELSTVAIVMPAMPMPFVPAEHHGRLVVMALMCHAGSAAAADQVIAPFRALADPIVDQVKPTPYPELFPPAQEDFHPTAVGQPLFMDHVDRGAAETILQLLQASDADMRAVQLRVLGGAMARVPVDATAFAHRGSRIMANVAAFYNDPAELPARRAWVDQGVAALRQSDDGVYVNFLANEGEAGVRAAYPGPTWDRLTAVKARYDPTNLFRFNHNIPPAAST